MVYLIPLKLLGMVLIMHSLDRSTKEISQLCLLWFQMRITQSTQTQLLVYSSRWKVLQVSSVSRMQSLFCWSFCNALNILPCIAANEPAQAQSLWLGSSSPADCATSNEMLNDQEDLIIDEGTITASASYSQGCVPNCSSWNIVTFTTYTVFLCMNCIRSLSSMSSWTLTETHRQTGFWRLLLKHYKALALIYRKPVFPYRLIFESVHPTSDLARLLHCPIPRYNISCSNKPAGTLLRVSCCLACFFWYYLQSCDISYSVYRFTIPPLNVHRVPLMLHRLNNRLLLPPWLETSGRNLHKHPRDSKHITVSAFFLRSVCYWIVYECVHSDPPTIRTVSAYHNSYIVFCEEAFFAACEAAHLLPVHRLLSIIREGNRHCKLFAIVFRWTLRHKPSKLAMCWICLSFRLTYHCYCWMANVEWFTEIKYLFVAINCCLGFKVDQGKDNSWWVIFNFNNLLR